MIRRTLTLVAIALLLSLISYFSAYAAVIRVSPDGSDGDGSTWATAKKTITAGLAAAAAGDQVWVAKGSYAEHVILNTSVELYGGFRGNEENLADRNPAANQTVIDGGGDGTVVKLDTAATSLTRVDGFTIRNGFTGVGCAAAGVVSGNTIVANTWLGVSCSGVGCTAWVLNNIIFANRYNGVAVSQSSATIANNIISANANGIECSYSHDSIVNNTIIANRRYGIEFSNSASSVTNNILAFNRICMRVSYGSSHATPVFRHNCFDGYPGYTGIEQHAGDVIADPRLVNAGYGKWHIQPDSPCIDSGISGSYGLTDIDGQPRLQGSNVDIGADESDGTTSSFTPAVVRVSLSGDDGNDGSTWELAKRTVRSAIDAASAVGGDVWVAAGVYNECITIPPYVYVYGGFAGTENARSERNWTANETILDGGKGGSVVNVPHGYRVGAVDGFTIRNGTGTRVEANYPLWGGGALCLGVPLLRNNTITENSADEGGGVWCVEMALDSSNNTITRNSATGKGGGVYCYGGTLCGNTITGNRGVGVYSISARVIGNIISGNGGGGVYGSGEVTNNTITSNEGYGIYCGDYGSYTTLTNNIVAFNSSGIYVGYSSDCYLICNCVYNPDGANYDGDYVNHDSDINVDPQMVSAIYGQVHVMPGSPCIDAGYEGALVYGQFDIDGQPRTQGTHIDIGADEFDGTAWAFAPASIHVSSSGSDGSDGLTWATAKRSVQAGVDAASSAGGGSVTVAEGIYNERIVLPPFVRLYGGYDIASPESPVRSPLANATVLDGGAVGSVVTIYGGHMTNVIDGFTIRNGKTDGNGGGINCGGSAPIISNNIITTNSAATGGGIYSTGSPSILGNLIVRNTAPTGGGMWASGSPTITGNTIASNTATKGGGLYYDHLGGSISNNIVAFNSSGIQYAPSTRHPTYSCNFYYYLGDTNGVDPMFVDIAADDYHLKATSPCINAGSTTAKGVTGTDIDSQNRIWGGVVDIGADEYHAPPTPLASAKALAEGSTVEIRDAVCTAMFRRSTERFCYIEDLDRVCGMRVSWRYDLQPGDKMNLYGAVRTFNGERLLSLTAPPVVTGTGTITPLAMPNRALGGGDFFYSPGPPILGQRGMAGRFGLNNIGLLVRTWGKVKWVSGKYMVDDGSAAGEVVIISSGVTLPNTGRYVQVTGISSCEKATGGNLTSCIRVRNAEDIVVLE